MNSQKPKLLMLTGLPGSGKTTYAKLIEHDPSNFPMLWKRVNKDDIRKDLKATGWEWSHNSEEDVIRERDKRIITCLIAGWSVISDDTNFAAKHKVRLEQIARECGADFMTKHIDTPVEECIIRDALRPADTRVGEVVIRKMAGQYGLLPTSLTAERVVPDAKLPPAVICDLDGTLSLFKEKGHRGPYDASKADEDDCNPVVYDIIDTFKFEKGYTVIYLSGRESTYRQQTMRFMVNNNCPYGPLFMRAEGDKRKDSIVKLELFDNNVRGKYDVKFVLDDRPSVLRMWQSIGLVTLAVGDLREF